MFVWISKVHKKLQNFRKKKKYLGVATILTKEINHNETCEKKKRELESKHFKK